MNNKSAAAETSPLIESDSIEFPGVQDKRTGTKDSNQFMSAFNMLDTSGNYDLTKSQLLQKDDEKTMKKWGNLIDTNSYVPGSFIRLVTLVFTIIIVPLQLFCDGLI